MKVINTTVLEPKINGIPDQIGSNWEITAEDFGLPADYNEQIASSSEKPLYKTQENGDTMTITAASLNAALKVLYDGQTLSELVYDQNARPFLSMLKKFKKFEGTIYPIPMLYEDGAGRSADFTLAMTNVGSPQLKQFQIDVVHNYDIARITTEAVLRSGSNKGAFVQGIKLNVDSAINRLSNDIESSLFRDGSGSIGTIDSVAGGSNVITLTNADDTANFSVGQKIVAANSITESLRSATASTITAVDRDAGTLTCSVTVPAGCDGYDGDLLFTQGDYVTASDKVKIAGLEAWLPATAPSSGDDFFNVDRSADPTRLAGCRWAGSSANVEESIIGGAHRLGRECGAVPDVALMSFPVYRALILELGSKVQRGETKMAQAGFQSVEVYGPRGLIKCVPCTFCPPDVVYLLTSSTWMLVSMGEPVRIVDQDGLKASRMYNADALEVRVMSWANLACTAPGRNCRISL